MSVLALITGLIEALAPIVTKLITGKVSEADARADAMRAIDGFLKDASDLPAVEAQDDSAADAAAGAKSE